MTLTVVHGTMGAGKTLFLTIMAFHSEVKVVSNYTLEFPYEPFDLQKFLEAGYSDCILLLDEAYIYLESRDSGLKRNKLGSYILFQSRKKNIDLFLSVQLKSTIDVRYRELAGRHIFCESIGMKPNIQGFKYILIDYDHKKVKHLSLTIEKAKTYFDLYDTNEVIAPPIEKGEFMTQEDQIKESKELANVIFENMGQQRCSKSYIKNWLAENKKAACFQDYVYQNLRNLQGYF